MNSVSFYKRHHLTHYQALVLERFFFYMVILFKFGNRFYEIKL